MRRIPLILILSTIALSSFSQSEIPVDMYTGQPSITIPIWNVTSGDVSQPVVLSYNANGALQKSPFGNGWNISTGSITREVRTYPDDVGNGLPVRGWFYKNPSNVTVATDIGNFVPAADNTTAWEIGEGTDHAKIKALANETGSSYATDTEPDIFHYSASGISGSFVFDNNLDIRTIPYADVVVTPTYTSTNDRKITSFTIATNDGYVYTFGHVVTASRTTIDKPYSNKYYYMPAETKLYYTTVTYTSEWKLTRIDSPNGNYVTLTYTNTPDQPSSSGEIGLYQYPDPSYANPSDIINVTAYLTSQSTEEAKIASITGSTGSKVEFNYSGPSNSIQTITISDDRRGSTTTERRIKTFMFEYQLIAYSYKGYGWNPTESTIFLNSLTESSECEILPPHKFSYNNVIEQTSGNPGTYLFASTGSDEWGHPNRVSNEYPFPKLYIYPSEPMINRYRTSPIPGYSGNSFIVPGARREAVDDVRGVLKSITRPEGGVTEFVFDGNRYLDPRTNQDLSAGGLRIRAISYYDGFNQEPIVKTFEYTDPITGLSSGRIIRKPNMAVPSLKWKSPSGSSHDKTFQTSGLSTEQRYQYMLMRRESDLTQGETTQGNSVGYKIVTVRRPGAGYARFEYLMPATYGDAATGNWAPTVNKFARSSTSSSVNMGVVDGSNTWGFPFTPNPNYDFERGLISKKSDYTSDHKLVQQTITTYQRLYKTGSTPGQVWGLKYDRYPGSAIDADNKIYFYGRYYLLTDVISVPAKEITTRYDLADATGNTKLKDSVEYLYESPYHKLVTQVKRYTSDGDIYTTRIKYPKDYTTYSTGAADATALHAMKSNNRYSMPVETIQTYKKAGNDSVWVVGGAVVKLSSFSGRIQPRSVWSLKASPPIYFNNFIQSTIYNPSEYRFRIDSRYERMDSIISYTTLGDVQVSRNPASRQTTMTGYGYSSSVPVVQLANLQLNNITDIQAAFSDFETTTDFGFEATTAYYGIGRTGLKAFYAKDLLSKIVTRAPGVTNYVFSFWVKSNTAFDMAVALRPSGGGAAYTTVTVLVPDTGAEYRYIQCIIPLTNVPAAPSTFKIELNAASLPAVSSSSASLSNVIDDVFFYPENAAMAAMTYTIPYGVASVTSGSGSASHTEYDKLGRPRIIYDKDKNIVSRKVYQYTSVSPLTADFSVNGVTAGTASVFTAVTSDCVTDATYEWDLGAGFQAGSSVLNHTFGTVGVYTVRMRVTSATYGTKTVSKTVSITYSSFTVEICVRGTYHYVNDLPAATASCPAILSLPSNWVAFKITTELSNATFQWLIREVGSGTWVNVGDDSNEYACKIIGPSPRTSFEVKCQITLSNGAIGFSDPIPVTFEYN